METGTLMMAAEALGQILLLGIAVAAGAAGTLVVAWAVLAAWYTIRRWMDK